MIISSDFNFLLPLRYWFRPFAFGILISHSFTSGMLISTLCLWDTDFDIPLRLGCWFRPYKGIGMFNCHPLIGKFKRFKNRFQTHIGLRKSFLHWTNLFHCLMKFVFIIMSIRVLTIGKAFCSRPNYSFLLKGTLRVSDTFSFYLVNHFLLNSFVLIPYQNSKYFWDYKRF